jgi:hypothetical protein
MKNDLDKIGDQAARGTAAFILARPRTVRRSPDSRGVSLWN